MLRVVKAGVAVVLLTVLFWQLDWTQAQDILGRVTLATLVVVLLAMSAELLISAWKWSRALRMHALEFNFVYLLRTVCTSYFFNNFLPTSVGGDAYRVYRTLPADGYRSRAVSAILIDRATGIAVLLTLGALGALTLLQEFAVARVYLFFYVAGVAAGIVGLAVLSLGWLQPVLARFRHWRLFAAIEHNVEYLKRARGAWVQQVALSLLYQLISISIVFWLFQNTGESVPFTQCALIAAAAGFAALLPLSINGIGLMEGSFVAMAVTLGVDYDQALLVAIVRRLMMMLLSLLCGGAYLLEGRPSIPAGAGQRTPGV